MLNRTPMVDRGCSGGEIDVTSVGHSIDCPGKTSESGRFASRQSGTTFRCGSVLCSRADRSDCVERGQSDTHQHRSETRCPKRRVSGPIGGRTPSSEIGGF